MIAYQIFSQEMKGVTWGPMDKQALKVDGFNVLMIYIFREKPDAEWLKKHLEKREVEKWPEKPHLRTNYKIVKVEIRRGEG